MGERIAIAVMGPGLLDAFIDPRFGRANAFVISDAAGTAPERIENRAADSAHGAGTGASADLARRGVTDVIAGRFGPKALRALEAAGVRAWLAEGVGSASEALDALWAGRLREAAMVGQR